MPELPEVETTVRALRRPLIGRIFTEVRCSWPRHVAAPDLPELQRRIHGRAVQAIERRGKYLIFRLSDGENLIIHLKMTGHLSVVDRDMPPGKYVHTIFAFANGQEMRFRDPRKFGRVYLVEDVEEVVGKLGPEPLAEGFSAAGLKERLNGRSRALKPLLLDQTFIAGVGNIYADESLFYAGLHPERRADSLSDEEIAALYAAIRKSLTMGIEREGASITTYVNPDGKKGDMQNALMVFRRTGEACYACGSVIQRIVMGGRSTHFCPTCQS